MKININKARKFLLRKREKQKKELQSKLKQHISTLKKSIKHITKKFTNIKEIYLFGSITNPRFFNNHSDIDIAVSGLSGIEDIKLSIELEKLLGTEYVDVINLDNVDDKIKKQIRKGELLYARNK